VNGKTTSGVSRHVPEAGQIALFVSSGTLSIRKIGVRRRDGEPLKNSP